MKLSEETYKTRFRKVYNNFGGELYGLKPAEGKSNSDEISDTPIKSPLLRGLRQTNLPLYYKLTKHKPIDTS